MSNNRPKTKQVASLFLGLCLSGLAGAQAGVTLLVTTDESCDWKLDGRPMGLLKVGNSKVVPVSPGSHVVEGATPDGVAMMRTEVNVDQGQKTVDIRAKSPSDPQVKMQHAETAKEPAQGDVAQTWTDPSTKLMWTKKDNGSDVDWNQAGAYCSHLQLTGYSGWRLPSIEELQGVYDSSISVVTVFDNGVRYGVHAKGNLQLTGWDWSSTQGDAPGKPWQVAWMLDFGIKEPRISTPLGFHYSMRALCVRHPKD